MVSLKSKINFLDWLIVHSIFTKREAYWLLTYLKEHPAILEQVVFVEQADLTPRGLVFEQSSEPENSFALYKANQRVVDHEKIFHDIRMNWQKTLYIECKIQNGWENQLYLSVLEDNPFATWNITLSKTVASEVLESISNLSFEQQRQQVLGEIDKALDTNDHEAFNQLTLAYQELIKKDGSKDGIGKFTN